MGALLALASAACYGVADYAGGLLSRRTHFASVAFTGQAGGLVLTLAAALLLPAATLTTVDLAWGALSGAGTGVGMVFLYRGLSRGAMSVVVPVSAVGGVALPVLVNVTLLGERPSPLSWLGIVLTLPALWLVGRTGNGSRAGRASPTGRASRARHGVRTGPGAATAADRASPGAKAGARSAAGTVDALIAGCGIAVQYLALAQADAASGIWPVASGRVAALLTVAPLVLASGRGLRMPRAHAAGAAGTGAIAALALVCYLLAVQQQLAVVAVVLSSLYPAVPVLLGLTLLRERLTPRQVAGLLGAGAATVLLTVA